MLKEQEENECRRSMISQGQRRGWRELGRNQTLWAPLSEHQRNAIVSRAEAWNSLCTWLLCRSREEAGDVAGDSRAREFSWSAVLCGPVTCLSKAQFPRLTNEITGSICGMRWCEGPVRNAWARLHPVFGTKQLLYSALTMSGTRCSDDEQEIAVPS